MQLRSSRAYHVFERDLLGPERSTEAGGRGAAARTVELGLVVNG